MTPDPLRALDQALLGELYTRLREATNSTLACDVRLGQRESNGQVIFNVRWKHSLTGVVIERLVVQPRGQAFDKEQVDHVVGQVQEAVLREGK